MAEVLRCEPNTIRLSEDHRVYSTCPSTDAAIVKACDLLRNDRVVAFPTETVYGLGASALSTTAASKIFAAKGRPTDNPLIVHISSRDMLKSLTPPDWAAPPAYEALMARFWPGPLTLLFPTTSANQPEPKVPSAVTAGHPTVAIRMPANSVARALIARSGLPLAAPSANASGRPSPTMAQHVVRDLSSRIDLILDGGPCSVGVESTVVDGLQADGILRILRLGGVSVEDIEACLRNSGLGVTADAAARVNVYKRDFRDIELEKKPTTPGMKYKHYSPDATVIVLDPVSSTQCSHRHRTENGQIHLSPSKAILSRLERLRTSRNLKGTLTIGLMLLGNGVIAHALQVATKSVSDISSEPVHPPLLDEGSLGRPLSVYLFRFSDIDDPKTAAQRLFAGLRYLDEVIGADAIFVERVAETGLGAAVMERLHKAAGGEEGIIRVAID